MFTSINPATNKAGASFAELTDAQIEARLALAHATFAQWRLTDLPERMTLLRHIAEVFEDDKDRLARIATDEMGKTLKDALNDQTLAAWMAGGGPLSILIAEKLAVKKEGQNTALGDKLSLQTSHADLESQHARQREDQHVMRDGEHKIGGCEIHGGPLRRTALI